MQAKLNLTTHITAIASLLAALYLAACTPIPIYKATDLAQSAHIKLSFKDESILAGVATIARVDGEIICEEPLPNFERMIVISKGNPLISDLNPSGARIPAGKKFTFAAMGLNDGFRECGRIVSFVPKIGSYYEIGVTNTTIREQYRSEPTACPVQVIEVNVGGSPLGPAEITYEQCKPRK